MRNSDSLKYWSKIAVNNPSEKSIKVDPEKNDFTKYDIAFIKKYIDSNTTMIDLGSGSGSTINYIAPVVKSLTAVEKFEEFSKFIIRANNVTVVTTDVLSYKPCKKFDLVTMFGLVHYFNEEETTVLYTRYFDLLNSKGKLIIKQQFGIFEDVLVSGYSENLKTNYYSCYRYIKNEISLLESIGFINVTAIDIYPPECNRWQNTHFYAIVAEKS